MDNIGPIIGFGLKKEDSALRDLVFNLKKNAFY